MAATIKDIARKTGLGLATISSYLNGGNVREKNRIKIEDAIEELQFEVNEVARGLKTNKTKTIGIIIPELNNIFCAEIITEVEDVLRSHGYAAMICDCRTDLKREEEAVEFLDRKRVDGLILMPSGNSGVHLHKFIKKGKPVVLIDRRFRDIACDCVLADNFGAARDAVQRLMDAGHTQIGMIAGPKGVFTADERRRGYEEAVKEAGVALQERLLIHGDYTISGGAGCMRELVDKNPDLTAVVVSNYEMTMGAIIEAREMELQIPERLSFIGFDNLEFARACAPQLSIVTQPTREMGREAAGLMVQKLNGEIPPEVIRSRKLQTGFVEGRTIKKR